MILAYKWFAYGPVHATRIIFEKCSVSEDSQGWFIKLSAAQVQ